MIMALHPCEGCFVQDDCRTANERQQDQATWTKPTTDSCLGIGDGTLRSQ